MPKTTEKRWILMSRLNGQWTHKFIDRSFLTKSAAMFHIDAFLYSRTYFKAVRATVTIEWDSSRGGE